MQSYLPRGPSQRSRHEGERDCGAHTGERWVRELAPLAPPLPLFHVELVRRSTPRWGTLCAGSRSACVARDGVRGVGGQDVCPSAWRARADGRPARYGRPRRVGLGVEGRAPPDEAHAGLGRMRRSGSMSARLLARALRVTCHPRGDERPRELDGRARPGGPEAAPGGELERSVWTQRVRSLTWNRRDANNRPRSGPGTGARWAARGDPRESAWLSKARQVAHADTRRLRLTRAVRVTSRLLVDGARSCRARGKRTAAALRARPRHR